MKQPQAIDLFSGCGGLTLGLTQAGFGVVGAVEIDSLAVETYKANHKHVFVWQKDITKLSVRAVKKQLNIKRGELDLLAGCPPCQGFSTMSTLNGKHGFNDPRNDLVFQFLRFVQALRPKAVMMENVPGLAKDERITKVVATLESMGYICGRNPQISQQAREGFEKNPYFEIRFWNQVFARTRLTYDHYRAVLECSVNDPSFVAKEEEVRRTRDLLTQGMHRGTEERAKGIPAQDVSHQGVIKMS